MSGTVHRTKGETLVLTRADVRQVVDMADCIEAVARAFALHAAGATIPPAILGVHVEGGGFHLKTAGLRDGEPVFAMKVNANFPANPSLRGLPTIQGLIALFDAASGELLAILDSIEITSLRTAAATAVAARHLARADAEVVAICGCGEQGRSQLRALAGERRIRRVYAWDADAAHASLYATEMARELRLDVHPALVLPDAVHESGIVVTCTSSRHWFLASDDVRPGTFVAAVGADSPEKQEIEPALLARATVVVDVLEQCATIGDLHHALDAGVMTRDDVHAELADVVAGRKPGRRSADEITVFDSTGTALQDVAVAAIACQRARERGIGHTLALGRA